MTLEEFKKKWMLYNTYWLPKNTKHEIEYAVQSLMEYVMRREELRRSPFARKSAHSIVIKQCRQMLKDLMGIK